MITHCLECDTYFRVSAEQLKTANGQVKCGCCMRVFNALESLLDNSESSDSSDSTETIHKETIGSALLGTNKDLPVHVDEVFVIEEHEATVEELPEVILETAIDTNDTNLTLYADLSEEDDDIEEELIAVVAGITADTQKSVYAETENLIGESDEDDSDDASLFGITIEEELVGLNNPPELQKQSSWIWPGASIFMFALLIFQFLNFNIESMLKKSPQLEPLCGFLDCPVVKELQNVSTIKLISRDVREHPQFIDVLLINATLINSTETRKSFPKLQLDLYDKVGRSIGDRLFLPDEYLDSSIDLDVGMKPDLPVHIVLEVMGSGEVASSFEFTFLE